MSKITLPAAVAAFVEAANAGRIDAYMTHFAVDAMVNDAQREFRGHAAIRAWAETELFAAKVTMDVVSAEDHHGVTIVNAKIDGNFDRTGLPDPLVLTYYFVLSGGAISLLHIVLNKKAL